MNIALQVRIAATMLAAVVGLVAGVVPAQAAQKPPAATGSRAMWLWTRTDPTAVIRWAAGHGVREIFAYVPADLSTSGDLPRLRVLKQRADAAGIRLTALGGDARWVFDPDAALAWQSAALSTGLFAGAHVDVEPYALAQWYADRATTVSAYLSLLGRLQAQSPAPLEADVPFWYATVPSGAGNLADQVLARVDAVTVMSYRDTATGPNSMMDVATDMLGRGSAAGKPVRLAAETQQLADCPYCTFYEEGQAQLARTLTTVDTAARAYPGYAGIAVHHYDSWVALRR
jgi:hypothetical protein